MNHIEITCHARGIDMQANAEVFGSPSLTLDMTVGDDTPSANVLEDDHLGTSVTVIRGGVFLILDMETAKEISDAVYRNGLEAK